MKMIAGVAGAIGVSLLTGASQAAIISGDVTSEGKAVRGALVTLFSADSLFQETVLTDAAGKYRLVTQQTGTLNLRARAPLDADDIGKLQVPAGTGAITHAFTLRRLTTPQEISESLPDSAHFARIKFPTLERKQLFQYDCLGCHPVGSPLTRKVRSPEVWTSFMKIMTRNAEYTSDVHVADYADALHRAFDGTPTPAHENTVVDEGALTARITEWKIPGALAAHDMDYDPKDASFYTVDQFKDQIYITDSRTNKTVDLPIPSMGVPVGGPDAAAGGEQGATWVPNVSHGVHSVQLGPDGQLYMTGSIGGEIIVLDPVHRTFKAHKIGGTAQYPHTLRFDSHGILWFSLYVSNQMGRFDPKTGRTTIIELPGGFSRKEETERPAAVYGVDISPLDGSVWYTKLTANKVGRIDPVTLKVQEWIPPVFGPRRGRFDKAGNLWIPGFADGKMTRLDTKSMKYETFVIPTLAPDEVEAPYAVAVDEKTQDVWVSVNISDRMFRFTPATKKWTAYPLPTRGLFTRDIVFTPDGRVCGASNPWGVPQEGIVEGNMDSVVCLQPEEHRTVAQSGN